MSLKARKIYSVSDLARETGIPLKSLTVLLEHHGEAIPFLMDGERRRYTSDALPVIRRFWREYKAGIKEDEAVESAWFTDTLDKVRESSEKLAELAKTLRTLQAELRKNPPRRVFYINAFPGGDLQPARPIAVLVDTQGNRSRATLTDADLEARGENDKAAVLNLREVILRTFLRMEQGEPSQDEAEQLSILTALIVRKTKAT
jgi:hypothetical protein